MPRLTPDDEVVRLIAELMRPGAPALLRCEALEDAGAPGVRVFLAARHTHVDEVLRDEALFSLSLYDTLLEQVAGPTRYFVGANTPDRQRRFTMLMAAQRHLAEQRGASATPSPQLATEYRGWIEGVARTEARAVLTLLLPRLRARAQVDFVREYAMLVAYRVTRQVVGTAGPQSPPLFARLFAFLRNVTTNTGMPLSLAGEQGRAMSMAALLHPLFGHVFGTVVRSPGWLVAPTRWATTGSLAAIDAVLDNPAAAPRLSLVRALAAIRKDFGQVDDDCWRIDARSILFELAGALGIVVANSLAQCADFMASPAAAQAGTCFDAIIAALADDSAPTAIHDATINETMRLAAGNRLVRTVTKTDTFHGIALNAGDRVVALVAAAGQDPAAFPDPTRFTPDPARSYLTSGPFDGPHVCYGRAIAWTVMRVALVEAARVMRPAPGARLAYFGGLPDFMAWEALPA